MNLHIIGGFLGSGKTTAIINASNLLMQQGKVVGVVTNDQGNYLVDTNFIASKNIPTTEVTNGCFCCNFNSLSDQLEVLDRTIYPDYIFAESVGSCTDLVATVLKPLQIFKKELISGLTFSVFVDSRLLLDHLRGTKLPFSDAVSYIFSKQIEEADLLIVNKIDLLPFSYLEILQDLMDAHLERKIVICQNSLNGEHIQNWLNILNSWPMRRRDSLDIDYQKYGKGEAELAWLDEGISIHTDDNSAWDCAIHLIEMIVNEIKQRAIAVGHLKFMVKGENFNHKISFTTLIDEEWLENLPGLSAGNVQIMVNARIETSPEVARSIVKKGVASISVPGNIIVESHEQAFQPGFPNPTYRITRKLPCCDECRCIKNLDSNQSEACLCDCSMDNGSCCTF
jgi:Ni2+-binding GTPase involved in maturation of urease and hydrogenase